jgi:hypothetical protein
MKKSKNDNKASDNGSKRKFKWWEISIQSLVVLISVFVGYYLSSLSEDNKKIEQASQIKNALMYEINSNTLEMKNFETRFRNVSYGFFSSFPQKTHADVVIRLLPIKRDIIWKQYGSPAVLQLDSEQFSSIYSFYNNLDDLRKFWEDLNIVKGNFEQKEFETYRQATEGYIRNTFILFTTIEKFLKIKK